MGSLPGHVVPGIFFVIHGLWWCYNSLWFHLKSKSSGASTKREKKSSATSFFEFKRDHNLSRKSWIPLQFTRIPLEPIVKIILSAFGIIVEAFFSEVATADGTHFVMSVYRVKNGEGQLNDMGKLHHITMYGSFMLSGIVDMLVLCMRFPYPISMVFYSLAFTVEGILFYLHTMGRDMFNVQVHAFLVYAIFACVIFSALRILSATNLSINLALGSCILLQGTWFIQAGYFLYGGFLDQKSGRSADDLDSHEDVKQHRYIMYMAACFAWHLLFIALGNMLLWTILSFFSRTRLFHKRSFRKRGFVASLQQGWKDQTDECNKLIIDELNGRVENGIELQEIPDNHS